MVGVVHVHLQTYKHTNKETVNSSNSLYQLQQGNIEHNSVPWPSKSFSGSFAISQKAVEFNAQNTELTIVTHRNALEENKPACWKIFETIYWTCLKQFHEQINTRRPGRQIPKSVFFQKAEPLQRFNSSNIKRVSDIQYIKMIRVWTKNNFENNKRIGHHAEQNPFQTNCQTNKKPKCLIYISNRKHTFSEPFYYLKTRWQIPWLWALLWHTYVHTCVQILPTFWGVKADNLLNPMKVMTLMYKPHNDSHFVNISPKFGPIPCLFVF